uniref:HAP1 N-terminal domain-containing protein n=1 Tax=Parascaris univalens TaxID=6257 RepID=A0A915BLP5_PARUN
STIGYLDVLYTRIEVITTACGGVFRKIGNILDLSSAFSNIAFADMFQNEAQMSHTSSRSSNHIQDVSDNINRRLIDILSLFSSVSENLIASIYANNVYFGNSTTYASNDARSGRLLSMANQIYAQNATSICHLSIRSRDMFILLSYQQIQLIFSYFGFFQEIRSHICEFIQFSKFRLN